MNIADDIIVRAVRKLINFKQYETPLVYPFFRLVLEKDLMVSLCI